VTSDVVAWPAPEPEVMDESTGWTRDKCLGRALKYLTFVQSKLVTSLSVPINTSSEMTAPWNDIANGEFLWRESNKHCAKDGYVLCGWPVVDIFPGSVKPDNTYSALKTLGKAGGRAVMAKYMHDRQSLPRSATNMVRMQYFAIGAYSYVFLHVLITSTDALTVTKKGYVIETETATEEELEGSKSLSDYPPLNQPVLVSSSGKVLVSHQEIEAEDVKRHRLIRKQAMKAMDDEDESATGDEGDPSNKGHSATGTAALELPSLKFSSKRAPVVPVGKAGIKGEDSDDSDSEMEVEERKGGRVEAKGKAKEKKEKKSKKRPRQVALTSSDEDEDAEEQKEEHSSKRRKKSSKSAQPSS
jgi:hypothetical protein